MIEEKLLFAIVDEKNSIAKGLCETPADSFEKYLTRVGQYQGLKKAEEIMAVLLADENEVDR